MALVAAGGLLFAGRAARASFLSYSPRQLSIEIYVSSPDPGAARAAVDRLYKSAPSQSRTATWYDDEAGKDHICYGFDFIAPGRTFKSLGSASTFPVRVGVHECEGAPVPGEYGLFGDAILYTSASSKFAGHLNALKKAFMARRPSGMAEVDTAALAKGRVKTTPLPPVVPTELPLVVYFGATSDAARALASAEAHPHVESSLEAALQDAIDRILAKAARAPAK